MKLKLLSLIYLLALTLSAGAAEEVKICGLSVTDELAAQGNLVPALNALDGVAATGTVTYNSATQTLVLDNAEITYTPASNDEVLYFTQGATNFTVQLVGTNKLTNAYDGYANTIVFPRGYSLNVTITGEGSLEVTSKQWYAVSLFSGSLKILDTTVTLNGDIADNSAIGGTLEITNSTVTLAGAGRLTDIVLNQCAIVEPAGAVIRPYLWSNGYYYDIQKNSSDNIVIKPTSTLEQWESFVSVYFTIKSKTEKTAMVVANNYYRAHPNHEYYIQPTLNLVSGSYRVTDIADYAFSGTYATKVPMTESIIERIGNYAFQQCNFKTVTLPSTVKHIGKRAFAQCSELTDIELNEGLESIGNYAFYQCLGLTTITIPSTVNTLVNSFVNCFNLKTVLVKRQQPIDILYDTFSSNVYNEATLVVPDGTVEAYKTTNNWKNFQNIVEQSAYDAAVSIAATSADAANAAGWYDLQGRRLTAQPTKKGLYIQHGRKAIR